MKQRVYIAGPLFSQAEREFNGKVDGLLAALGFSTFLPQRDGHLLSDLIRAGEPEDRALRTIFELDVRQIEDADIFLLILDGRVPDEGACVELGIAWARNKKCIGLKTDPRSLMGDLDNPLIRGALDGKVAGTFDELRRFLLEGMTA